MLPFSGPDQKGGWKKLWMMQNLAKELCDSRGVHWSIRQTIHLVFRMMLLTLSKTPLTRWMPFASIFFFVFVANSYIFCLERRKRRLQYEVITCKYLSRFSYLCIAAGPLIGINDILRYFQGVCLVTRNTHTILFFGQVLAMESFQLYRLYYCFSQHQIQSKTGYPKWIFILMFIIMTSSALLGTALFDLAQPTIDCGIDRNGDVFYAEISVFEQHWNLLLAISFALTFGVDLSTVLLYWCKIRSVTIGAQFKEKKYRAIYERIQSILHRVLILTFWYQLISFWAFAIGAAIKIYFEWTADVYTVSAAISSVALSHSMFLMQDHNTSEYAMFLKILERCKLYLCCCCCYGMVRKQHCILKAAQVRVQSVSGDASPRSRDLSDEEKHGTNTTGMELSLPTRTIVTLDASKTSKSCVSV